MVRRRQDQLQWPGPYFMPLTFLLRISPKERSSGIMQMFIHEWTDDRKQANLISRWSKFWCTWRTKALGLLLEGCCWEFTAESHFRNCLKMLCPKLWHLPMGNSHPMTGCGGVSKTYWFAWIWDIFESLCQLQNSSWDHCCNGIAVALLFSYSFCQISFPLFLQMWVLFVCF